MMLRVLNKTIGSKTVFRRGLPSKGLVLGQAPRVGANRSGISRPTTTHSVFSPSAMFTRAHEVWTRTQSVLPKPSDLSRPLATAMGLALPSLAFAAEAQHPTNDAGLCCVLLPIIGGLIYSTFKTGGFLPSSQTAKKNTDVAEIDPKIVEPEIIEIEIDDTDAPVPVKSFFEIEIFEDDLPLSPFAASLTIKEIKGQDTGFTADYVLADGTQIQIAMVADGVSSGDMWVDHGDSHAIGGCVRGGELAARYLRETFEELVKTDPTLFDLYVDNGIYDEVATLMTDKFRAFYEKGHSFESLCYQSIASTLSFVVSRTDAVTGRISVRMYCVGDSPVMLVTPGRLLIHCVKADDDRTYAISMSTVDGLINDGKVVVFAYEQSFPAGTPLMLLSMTDGMLAIDRRQGLDQLKKAVLGLQAADSVQGVLEQFRIWASNGEGSRDDTTVSGIITPESAGLSALQILGEGFEVVEI